MAALPFSHLRASVKTSSKQHCRNLLTWAPVEQRLAEERATCVLYSQAVAALVAFLPHKLACSLRRAARPVPKPKQKSCSINHQSIS